MFCPAIWPAQVCLNWSTLCYSGHAPQSLNYPWIWHLTVQILKLCIYVFCSPRICQRRRLSSNPSCSIETVTVWGVVLLIEGHDFEHLCHTSITSQGQSKSDESNPTFRLTESSNKTECTAAKNTMQRSKLRTWRISIMSMCKRIKANWTSKKIVALFMTVIPVSRSQSHSTKEEGIPLLLYLFQFYPHPHVLALPRTQEWTQSNHTWCLWKLLHRLWWTQSLATANNFTVRRHITWLLMPSCNQYQHKTKQKYTTTPLYTEYLFLLWKQRGFLRRTPYQLMMVSHSPSFSMFQFLFDNSAKIYRHILLLDFFGGRRVFIHCTFARFYKHVFYNTSIGPNSLTDNVTEIKT